jgi:NAD(P)-dependent dehydrogenase (short-subunit alcohol dehydrogenase family)
MRSGRVVVITGGSGGIGQALVRRFLDNDDRVYSLDRDEGVATGAPHLDCDITDEHSWEKAIGAIAAEAGRVDVLVNCAGWFPVEPFEDISAARWRQVIEVNLTSVFLGVQAVLPLMTGRGWGRIVNFGSGTFFKGTARQAHYVAAKAGVVGLTRCLATELGVHGITVNTITPGLTLTEAAADIFPPAFLESRRNERALPRNQVPEDVVGATFFIASPDADFMTGQMLVIDGGNVRH